VGVYCLAIVIAGTSCKRMTGAFLVSLLFLYATTIIHPGNPQNYDIFFPLFFLLYVFLIKRSSPASPDHKWLNVLLPFFAGFFLSMAELTRPFMIFFMPVLALSAYWSFRKGARKKQFLAFIIPVLILSGGWNGYQFFAHQQITFSNHTGFNLSRAWPNVPQSDLVDEIHDTPLVDDRWENLNTPEHSANSKQRQKTVFRYWLDHPYESLITALKKVVHFLSGETAIYTYEPKSDWFWVYKLFVGATAALLLANAGILFIQLFHFKRMPEILSNQDNVMLLFAAASIFLMAIGDMGEEARFLISVLPFLATMPVYRSWKVDTAGTKHTFW